MTMQTVRLLLVEDNPGDARLVQEYLTESETEFEVTCAGTLSEALAHLVGQDVILLNLSLPNSQGLETFTRLQAQVGDIPIVILSAQNGLDVALKAVQLGAQDYLLQGRAGAQRLERVLCYAIARVRHWQAREAYHRLVDMTNSVVLFASMLEQSAVLDEENVRRIEIIKKQAMRAAELARGLLNSAG